MSKPCYRDDPAVIDIGTNLLHPQFDADRADVLVRAKTNGVETIVITSTDLPSSHASQQFIDQHVGNPLLYTTAGVHPHDAKSAPADLAEQLLQLAQHPSVVAIGEAGLDYNREFSPRDTQQTVFRTQAEIAAQLQRTLFVHDRESQGDTLAVLEQSRLDPEHVIIHCFTGTEAELDAYLERGYWIGITGWVCDKKRGADLRAIVTKVPLDRLLIETDAPFLLPHNVVHPPPVRRRNEPMYLRHVADQLAELFGIASDEIRARTAANALRAFAISR